MVISLYLLYFLFKHITIYTINMRLYFEHPKKVCMTYIKHMKLSLYLSYLLAKGSAKAIVHAFLPRTQPPAEPRNHDNLEDVAAAPCGCGREETCC